MSINEWATALIREIKETGTAFLAFIKSPSPGNALAVLVELVQAAEKTLAGPGRGVDKRAAVKAAVELLDEEFNFKRAIDDLIKLPAFLEMIDNMLIDRLIDLLINVVVGVLNRTIWREA